MVWPTLETVVRKSFPGVRERALFGQRTRLALPQVRLALQPLLAAADGPRAS